MVVALLFCEELVKNSTVGWEDYMLLNTFYSLDVNNKVQSAGNSDVIKKISSLYRGSSETIRGSCFDSFRKIYESYFGKKFEESDDWLL